LTEESRRANLATDIERGAEALAAAELLARHGMHPDAVSRAYYAMLHHARALLLTEGHQPKSQGGVAYLLNLHFVRPGLFSADQARAFARLQADREDADYDSAAVFTEEQTAAIVALAARFCEACRGAIRDRGY
jgi:uncharacterized protein (UPF0332 family)